MSNKSPCEFIIYTGRPNVNNMGLECRLRGHTDTYINSFIYGNISHNRVVFYCLRIYDTI